MLLCLFCFALCLCFNVASVVVAVCYEIVCYIVALVCYGVVSWKAMLLVVMQVDKLVGCFVCLCVDVLLKAIIADAWWLSLMFMCSGLMMYNK